MSQSVTPYNSPEPKVHNQTPQDFHVNIHIEEPLFDRHHSQNTQTIEQYPQHISTTQNLQQYPQHIPTTQNLQQYPQHIPTTQNWQQYHQHIPTTQNLQQYPQHIPTTQNWQQYPQHIPTTQNLQQYPQHIPTTQNLQQYPQHIPTTQNWQQYHQHIPTPQNSSTHLHDQDVPYAQQQPQSYQANGEIVTGRIHTAHQTGVQILRALQIMNSQLEFIQQFEADDTFKALRCATVVAKESQKLLNNADQRVRVSCTREIKAGKERLTQALKQDDDENCQVFYQIMDDFFTAGGRDFQNRDRWQDLYKIVLNSPDSIMALALSGSNGFMKTHEKALYFINEAQNWLQSLKYPPHVISWLRNSDTSEILEGNLRFHSFKRGKASLTGYFSSELMLHSFFRKTPVLYIDRFVRDLCGYASRNRTSLCVCDRVIGKEHVYFLEKEDWDGLRSELLLAIVLYFFVQ
jgi:hypothetical protein